MFLDLNVARREERLLLTVLYCTVNERGASRAQLRFSKFKGALAWFFLCWESNQSEAEMKKMIGGSGSADC